jgi:hypothetical protein
VAQLTLNLSDDAAQQASTMAALEGRDVGEYIASLVEEQLRADPERELKLLASLSDDDVLAMADLQMTPDENARLGELLDRNREAQLQRGEQEELAELMRIYTHGSLKKAMGLGEAVRRKLRKPLSP